MGLGQGLTKPKLQIVNFLGCPFFSRETIIYSDNNNNNNNNNNNDNNNNDNNNNDLYSERVTRLVRIFPAES